MMMKRTIFQKLTAWKNNPKRQPLILMGARQVGKTYILKKFGKTEYDNVIYLNFETTPSLKTLFDENLEPKKILKSLAIEMDTKILPNKTFIFFDEVQECPNALNSLKYFDESAKEYHIAAAGSLLGIKLAHTKGFPVGKVNFLTLYPLSFLEFLEGLNQIPLKEYIEQINKISPLPTILHEKLLHYFKIYLYTGGMPKAVAEYIDTEDFMLVREVHQDILKAYSLDFAKHAPENQIMKINQVWQAIPNQLAKENKKFVFSVIRKGARAKTFETAIQWLVEAGLIYKVHNTSTSKIPLEGYVKFDFFKTYLLDVGLLGAMVNLSPKVIIQGNQLYQEFRGAFIENFAAQALTKAHHKLYYWTSEGTAKLDFLLEQENAIYPVEIKSGLSTKQKSLRVYTNKYQPKWQIRGSERNLKKDGNLLNCPLYLIGELSRLITMLD